MNATLNISCRKRFAAQLETYTMYANMENKQ